MSKDITLKTIAQKLGISQSTVSRALSDKYGVNKELKSRIRLIALDMGYSISTEKDFRKENGYITVVVNRHDFDDKRFYGKVIESLEQELSLQNLHIRLSIIDPDTTPSYLNKRTTDGIICIGMINEEQFSYVLKANVPILLLDIASPHFNIDCITANNYKGAYEFSNNKMEILEHMLADA